MHLRNRLLSKLIANNPLDDRAHPMTNTSQAPGLKRLHREMADQMRIMNENNALLMQHLTANNPTPPPPTPIDPPFIERVMRTRVSSRFKLPTQLRVYEGKIDPMGHLDLYKSLMALQGYSDEVMYKAFFATLKGSARSWYRKLSPGTIDSFDDLSKLFVANFMSCQAILEVEDPSDKVVIMAIMEGLCLGPLFKGANCWLYQEGITDTEMEALRAEMEKITLVDPKESENAKHLEEIAPISIHPKAKTSAKLPPLCKLSGTLCQSSVLITLITGIIRDKAIVASSSNGRSHYFCAMVKALPRYQLDGNQFCLLNSNCINPLADLLLGEDTNVQIASVEALSALLLDSTSSNGFKRGADELKQLGVIDVVIHLFTEFRHEELQEKAIWMLSRLLRAESLAPHISLNQALVRALVEALKHGCAVIKRHAQEALANLSGLMERHRVKLGHKDSLAVAEKMLHCIYVV
ncbi:hypothetical protein Acr_28g0003440 [Actinidia rufa]|uniref:ARM repeat superfamily protein n=1 Tax=Actinidia rufa TaxID=165716 RepID=A0A7J0H993_9ERIC|nr:hypothetical protein Acr_28g0003440 [Actinidia rufa]